MAKKGTAKPKLAAKTAFYRRTKRVMTLLTVQEILNEEHLQKM
jgi:hypothetical protein